MPIARILAISVFSIIRISGPLGIGSLSIPFVSAVTTLGHGIGSVVAVASARCGRQLDDVVVGLLCGEERRHCEFEKGNRMIE